MAIKYKIIARGQPGVKGGGTKKYYASANIAGERSLAELTDIIETISTVSGIDITAVLHSFVTTIPNYLKEGEIVRLGELGSLRVSISSKGMDTPQEVKASSVVNARVIFTPGKMLRDMIPELTYEKM